MPICDICGKNHATRSITRIRNGERHTTNICEECSQKQKGGFGLEKTGFGSEPNGLENIFGNIFGDIFGGKGLEGGRGSLENRRASEERIGFQDFLSNSAREVLYMARDYARKYKNRVIDTEHLLLALLDNEAISKILNQLKADKEVIKSQTEAVLENGDAEPEFYEYSPRMKRILDLSLDEARAMNHNYIGSEHLFLASAREEEGAAAQILKKNKIDLMPLRQRILKTVGKGEEESVIKMNTPVLDQFSRDLTLLAHQGKLDPVIGRSKEIETAIEILSRRTKNNPVLIGEAGVGKTAIVEGLAQRIINGNVSESLYGKRVVELNIASILAGTRFRGDLEERLRQVIDEIKDNSGSLVVFIDEIHLLVGAGTSGEGGMDAANIFKPALARGELNIVGATTLREYKKYIEKDQALERRFQPIVVPEPTPEQTLEILFGLRDRYESHHRVKITNEALRVAVELSNRYITARFLPDKAIDLIDQSSARVRIKSTTEPEKLKLAEEKLHNLKKEKEALVRSKKSKELKMIEREIKSTENERDALFDAWQETRGRNIAVVEAKDVAEIVSRLTGIPVSELTEEEKEKLLNLEKKLHARVVGQDEAITAVASAIRRSRAGLSNPYRPIASFLFLGPTGVGKTELAKTLAYVLFGQEDAIIRIDMSEYMERHNVARLIGAPPGYVGFEEGGQLTEAVRRRPHAIILLDEIEKAHPDVFNVLLQVFEDGRLTDGQGRIVNFTNTVIIATSNAGSEFIQHEIDKPEKQKISYEDLKKKLLGELKNYFRPEFLNRMDEIIVFRALDREQIKGIVRLRLKEAGQRIGAVGYGFEVTDSAVDQLSKEGYDPHFGARELRRIIQKNLENKISEEILKNKKNSKARISVDYKNGGYIVSFK